MQLLITYAIATVIFFGIDMLWLGVVAKNIYRQKLGFILSPEINWPAAIVFYLIYIAGILFFAVQPSLKDMSWQTALLNGALLGGLCYATYDLTNMATIAKWPLDIVLIDIVWGMVLTGSVSLLTHIAVSRLFEQ